MAYSPIAFTAVNYRDYKFNWLKAYEPGTTTPKAMGTDSTLGALISKAQVNIDGFFVSAGGTLITPYVDGTYDLWLFPTEAEAEANDTSSALRLADAVTGAADLVESIQLTPVSETVTLLDGQTVVTFVAQTTPGAEFNINGQGLDSRLLTSLDINEGLTTATTITLFDSYPAGALVTLSKNTSTGSSVVATVEEEVVLTDGQTVVTFSTLTTESSEFHINGIGVDSRLLTSEDINQSLTAPSSITLFESYPAGSIVTLAQNSTKGSINVDITNNIIKDLSQAYEFDTVALMKASTIVFPAGKILKTKGYYVKGDAGAARYLIKAAQAFDGYADHELVNGTVAVLQIGDAVNIDKFGALKDGAKDNYLNIKAATDYIKSNGGGTLTNSSEDNEDNYSNKPLRYLTSQKIYLEVEKMTVNCPGSFGPHGVMTDYIFEITMSSDESYDFFEGATWLWPKKVAVNLKVDGRSPDLQVNQCKAYKIRRIGHSKLELFEEQCVKGATWITDSIESDIYLTSRASGEDTANYVQHNGSVYCAIRNHTGNANNEPGVGGAWTLLWALTPRTPTTEPAWVLGNSYIDGEDGAPLWVFDLPGVWDGNNNLRFWGLNIAYPKGSLMRVKSLDKVYGCRNIFFYGAQIHHQDSEQTGSEGVPGQPNNPGLNHSPAVAGPVAHSVGVVLEWVQNVQFFGGNIRKGQTAAGSLIRFGDAAGLRPVRNIGFTKIRFTGEGDNLVGFDFVSVEIDAEAGGVDISGCAYDLDSGTGSQVYIGDGTKVTFSVKGTQRHKVWGNTSDVASTLVYLDESIPRWQQDNSGQMKWSDGTNAADVILERSAANVLFTPTGTSIGGDAGLVAGDNGFTAATNLGSVIGVVTLRGAGGGVRGYMPVYNTFS